MIIHDLRHAFRQLIRIPGFTLTAMVTLALGIGANSAIFSVVNGVLRHPAGVDHPERVAVQNTSYKQLGMDFPGVSVPDYADAAALHDQVEAAAIVSATNFNMLHDGRVEHLSAALVSSQWFQVFGARPILGRTFTAEEDEPNTGPVAVISFGLWQRVFGGSREAIGQTLMLDQKPYQVIGVMRSDFDWPRRNQVWVPIALAPKEFAPDQRYNETYRSVLRLRPGASIAQVNAGLVQKVREEYRREGKRSFGSSSQWSMYTSPLADSAAGPLRKPLYVLFGVVTLVLLIASANVAGLFLARTSARTHEFAIRTALGANASTIVSQLLTETMLLAAAATLIGIAAGPVFGRVLLWLIPHSLAEGYTVQMDPVVLTFTAAAGLLTSCSLRASAQRCGSSASTRLSICTRAGVTPTGSVEKQRLRSAVRHRRSCAGTAPAALPAPGLFLQPALRQLQNVDPGFNPNSVAAGVVYYSGQDMIRSQPRQAAFVDSVLGGLAAQPGVTAVAAIDPLPFDPQQGGSSSFGIVGRPTGPNDPGPHSDLALASSDYLKVMQIPLLAGRWISPGDRANTESVVVIDGRLAKKFWPNQSPIGQHISDYNSDKQAVVVGVVATIRNASLEQDTSDGMRYYALHKERRQHRRISLRAPGWRPHSSPWLRRCAAPTPPQTARRPPLMCSRVNLWSPARSPWSAASSSICWPPSLVSLFSSLSSVSTDSSATSPTSARSKWVCAWRWERGASTLSSWSSEAPLPGFLADSPLAFSSRLLPTGSCARPLPASVRECLHRLQRR